MVRGKEGEGVWWLGVEETLRERKRGGNVKGRRRGKRNVKRHESAWRVKGKVKKK